MVEDLRAIRQADLRALVANDRAVEAEPLDPGQRARKRPAGAGDDRHAGLEDPAQRRDVARVEVQLQVQDRAVEVEGHQPVAQS